MSPAPAVTVLIPSRNEARDIERCIEAVLRQDYPHDRMEVILVDGRSDDGTATIARRALEAGDINWKVLTNPVGSTPSNLNVGLAAAAGEVVCRVDSRSVVPPHYVRTCVDVLQTRPEVIVTGGAQVALAADDEVCSVGIARALNNRYAMGGSRYRSGAASGPSDTVYLGAFRTAELRSAGGWDEFFATNQDYELNRRLGRSGTVWFDARVEVGYLPRHSLVGLWRQYYRFGRWKVRYWRYTGDRPQPRQLVPLLGASAVALATLASLIGGYKRVRVVSAVNSSVCGLALLDLLGSPPGRAPVTSRPVTWAAIAVVVIAWVSGVLREAISPTWERCR